MPNSPVGNISVLTDGMKRKFENIDDIIKNILPRTYRAYWPLWFQGNYKSGLAHVDLDPGTTNFYCLQRGKKDVVIADYDVTRHHRSSSKRALLIINRPEYFNRYKCTKMLQIAEEQQSAHQ